MMDCDIQLHVEVMIDGRWHHYNCPRVDRSYLMFAKMAGVRNRTGLTPIAEPRGLPKNTTLLTLFDFNCPRGIEAHSASWLTWEEIKYLRNWFFDTYRRQSFERDYFGYLFGRSFDEEPLRYVPAVRFVFWFYG